MGATWLSNAVFYEIYPQSFYDSNGDGIGDLNGITEKLDYIKSLGCNALWLNPIYDSPFQDAGYDVIDHKKVAPRYGTEADLVRLFDTAHAMGIHVLLDLVPGHTSERHPDFLRSAQETPNEMSDRYIWTDSAFSGGDGMVFIGGEHPRDATYIVNFFKCQPALNYGYYERHLTWQQSMDAPAALANREAMKDIMRHWLALGCDGFRVDMADSLVKKDAPGKPGTMEVWKDIAGAIHAEYPQAALVSEWNCPTSALNCGFDMDFFLNWGGNGYAVLMRDYDVKDGKIINDNSYFKASSTRDPLDFLNDYLPKYEQTKHAGMWCMITGNHDVKRPTANLDDTERRLAYSMILTMPGAPFLYYGDEIGMRYQFLPTKEGGYHRTGSRTPMQWDGSENLGFSKAPAHMLYLPVDAGADAPTVAAQDADSDSLLNYVRRVIALRQGHDALQNHNNFAPYHAAKGDRLFAYKRGDYLLIFNPDTAPRTLVLDGAYTVIFEMNGAKIDADAVHVGAQSFAVLQPKA